MVYSATNFLYDEIISPTLYVLIVQKPVNEGVELFISALVFSFIFFGSLGLYTYVKHREPNLELVKLNRPTRAIESQAVGVLFFFFAFYKLVPFLMYVVMVIPMINYYGYEEATVEVFYQLITSFLFIAIYVGIGLFYFLRKTSSPLHFALIHDQEVITD